MCSSFEDVEAGLQEYRGRAQFTKVVVGSWICWGVYQQNWQWWRKHGFPKKAAPKWEVAAKWNHRKRNTFHSMNKSSETLTYPSLRAKGNTNPPRHRSTWKQISELKANSPSSCKRNWQHESKTPIRDTDRQMENKVTYLNRVNDAMWKPRSRSNNLKIQQLQVHWTFQHRTKIGNGITKTLESG